ncbi:DUF4832 domain-containing protein [Capnocytophaga sputigena]|uniref:DUF4832 domain-containing protein n=1 Tax=Capnocytophaga sputigena TaxID=1019 RepID=UPI0028D6DE7C|nr:DUF4832 domain-containing protein [Capnocytophaga sputigena]
MKKCFLTLCALLAVSISCQSKEDNTNSGESTQSSTTQSQTTQPLPPNTQLTQIVNYQPTNEIFLNPERGFLTHQDQKSDSWQLNANWVREKREKEGLSLVLTIYYMNEFREQPISESYLNRIRNNMRAIREGGSKVVLRFAYSYDENDYNKGKGDASWQWTEKHLNQLAPIIKENADIIAVWESGFVGVWGEWYYTNHYNFEPADNTQAYEPRKKVLAKELSILPKDRMVSVRYPKAKLYTQNIGVGNALTAQTAFSGSDLSRIGFHNDCFLADDDDTGTYHHIQEHRKYVANETQYVVMGGETCRPASGYSSYAECSNALKDMATYHWSYLNQDYYEGILNLWKNKCMDDIKRRLGYRFVLTQAKFNENITVGGKLQIALNVKNEGFAAPFNPREVQIVLTKKGTGEKHIFKVNTDPRRWAAGSTTEVGTEINLPKNLTAGEYNVYLNLPDPYKSLSTRPEYSIRLANKEVWEPQTGYNKIHTIKIKN